MIYRTIPHLFKFILQRYAKRETGIMECNVYISEMCVHHGDIISSAMVEEKKLVSLFQFLNI